MSKKYPNFKYAVKDVNNDGLIWLHLQPFKVNNLNVVPRTAIWDIDAIENGRMSFAIVEGWSEKIAHQWDKFDSITSGVLNKVTKMGDAFLRTWGVTKSAVVAGASGSISADDISEHAFNAKVDEALIYKDSPRREMTFSLNLAAHTNPITEVIEPVKLLQKYSSAEAEDTFHFNWPYIFDVTVSSVGAAFIRMQHAALVNVDVEWKMPFIKAGRGGGVYPGVAALTLSFIELDPLYRQRFL